MKKIFSLLILATFILLSISFISATTTNNCGYGDHSGCKLTETIVEGKIYFEDTNKAAGNADVTVICYHDGKTYTQTTDSLNPGILKGTYFTIFPQSKCIAGDKVVVSATKDGKFGSEDGIVKNWITQKKIDIDVAIVNVPLVPEFGIGIGVLTILSSVGIFFLVRKK